MLKRDRRWIIPGAVILLLLLLVPFLPAPVQAQCGTQASSCKECHEVQGQDSVNSKGAWHTDHAFGDFCEYCHAGNVQATDKAAAHQGLVAWNADVKASCASCHASDYEQRAQTYATALGVKLNTGAGTPSAGDSTKSGQTSESAPSSGPALAVSAPSGGTVIDFNKANFDMAALNNPPFNWGNAILIALILGITFGGGGLVVWREDVVRKLRDWRATPYVAATLRTQGLPAEWQSLVKARPELAALVPALDNADPATLRALSRLLADPERNRWAIQALGQLDPKLIDQLRELTPQERELLLALAR
jgi:hypothetical protein